MSLEVRMEAEKFRGKKRRLNTIVLLFDHEEKIDTRENKNMMESILIFYFFPDFTR